MSLSLNGRTITCQGRLDYRQTRPQNVQCAHTRRAAKSSLLSESERRNERDMSFGKTVTIECATRQSTKTQHQTLAVVKGDENIHNDTLTRIFNHDTLKFGLLFFAATTTKITTEQVAAASQSIALSLRGCALTLRRYGNALFSARKRHSETR